MCLPHRESFVKNEMLFQVWLLLVPIVNLIQIQWNLTFFMASFTAKFPLSFNSLDDKKNHSFDTQLNLPLQEFIFCVISAFFFIVASALIVSWGAVNNIFNAAGVSFKFPRIKNIF